MSDEWCLAGVGHNGNGRLPHRLSDVLEAGCGNLEDPAAAEPRRGWSDGAVHRPRDRGHGPPERLGEGRDEVILHLAQEAHGDVPLLWPHRPEACHRTQLQRRKPPYRRVVGPHGDEHPHAQVCPTVHIGGWESRRPRAGCGGTGGELTGVLDMFGLEGRVVVITGASSGLGAAVALAVAQAGADVVIGARRREMLEATAARVEGIGRKALVVPTDVTVVEDCQRLVQRATETFGRLDGLVNNAGVATAVPALQESPEQFRAVIDLNLMGAYWTAQAAAAAMTSGGSIVNVSSIIGLTSAELPQAAYATSKAGLLGLTRDLAAQWSGRRSIRVNALAPGFFESEMTDLCRPGTSSHSPDGHLSAVSVDRRRSPRWWCSSSPMPPAS